MINRTFAIEAASYYKKEIAIIKNITAYFKIDFNS